MNSNKLDTTDIENIEDLIPSIEKMYKFKFDKGETFEVKTFDELCELIIKKIDFKNVESCSTQQAFYKLRNSLVEEKIIKNDKLKPETKLKSLFPNKDRIKLVKKVEKNIGFNLNLLQAPKYLLISLTLIFATSFILLFLYWQIGISGILLSLFGFYLCKLFGKEMQLETVRELVEKITTENYLDIRTEKNTVNKSELKDVITNWFADNLEIEKEKLKTATFT
jgi:hypothetical protein